MTITDTAHNLFFALWILCYLNPLVSSKTTFACGINVYNKISQVFFWFDGAHGWMCVCVCLFEWMICLSVYDGSLQCIHVFCYSYLWMWWTAKRLYLNRSNTKMPTTHFQFNKNTNGLLTVSVCVCVLHAQLESNWLDNKNRNLTFKWSSSSMSCHFIFLCHS